MHNFLIYYAWQNELSNESGFGNWFVTCAGFDKEMIEQIIDNIIQSRGCTSVTIKNIMRLDT